MSKFFQRNSNTSRRRSLKSRRPRNVSRRRKQHQLGFEILEDRRVMSADSPLEPLQGDVADDIQAQVQSYSSATEEGRLQILLNELYWQSLLGNSDLTSYQTLSIPTDPLVSNQWHLINTGQQVGNPDFQSIFAIPGEDINVAPVWNQDIFGNGVVVAVIDSGVEKDHPDLLANIHPFLEYDALEEDGDASPDIDEFDPEFPFFFYDPSNAHGTAVAGLIGGVANNDTGITGVAPGIEIVPIRLIDPFAFSNNFNATEDAFRFATDQIDITNNSWKRGGSRILAGPSADEVLALRDSVFFGRDGLGVIHVFAAGNDGLSAGSANYNGFVNSRYTIGVTGVDHDGEYNNVDGTTTGYPETGSSVFVAAPTGSVPLDIANDTGLGSGLWTTDTTGDTGFNVAPDPDTGQEFDRDFLLNTDYTSRFNGTSAAAPLVSGVIALMLEENPNLTWRDVQEILVRSARQNAEFATQADGLDKALGIEYQSTWIINQVPVFHDPDVFSPGVDPFTQVFNPTLDPNLFELQGLGLGGAGLLARSSAHYAPTPQVLTNGAGYTVSQGRGTNRGEDLGFAHGVIDAELAVELARQWHTKGQALPDELSFTTEVNVPNINTVPAAEAISFDDSDVDYIVPGGLGGLSGFGAYFEEYFADDPFSDADADFNIRGLPAELTVPSPNDMTVETIEVRLSISGGVNAALDNLRIVLVSPNGTHSELNHYYVDPSFAAGVSDIHQVNNFFTSDLDINGSDGVTDDSDFLDPSTFFGVPDQGGSFSFTFSTNRNWGERSDNAIIFDPTTNEPIIDNNFGFGGGFPGFFNTGGNVFNAVSDDNFGDLFTQGWQLHFENYGTTALTVDNIEVAWHGSPIGANTQRVQGLIGVDDNRDDLFSFSRVIQQNFDTDGVVRLGEVQNLIDPNHESMGANVTVFAYRDVNANGILDAADSFADQFVTGADGNYYFDLVPDDYIFTIEDPLGRTAIEDSLTPNGFLQDYKTEWAVSSDFFKIWDYDTNLQVPLQADGTPFSFLDGSGDEIVYGIKNLNFLLDPGAPTAPQVDFSGVVFADVNSDGLFNGSDVNVPQVTVFVDANRNGQFDAGEASTQTDINGEYSLTAPVFASTVVNVGVLVPANWTASEPDDAIAPFFVSPGDDFNNVDFAITPPVGTGPGNGTGQGGYLLGVVYEDVNGDGVRQSTDPGQSGITVYVDANNSGSFEAGERNTVSQANGAFIMAGVTPGTKIVRIETAPPLVPINPGPGGAQVVSLAGGGTVSSISFGIGNTATLDYGDLPAEYGITLLSENGARHSKGVYFLGSMVDTELDGQPDDDALGDDAIGADEDGIVVDPLVEGSVLNHLVATASRHGGYLQAWVDFNGDNDFNDVGERIITNQLLSPGANDVFFAAPAVIEADRIFARFRYGEFGINSVTGQASIGEVEDHELFRDAPPPAQLANGPDFDDDGDIDGMDFLKWQLGFGMANTATATDGDANGDQNVDGGDFAEWDAEFGGGVALATAPATGDFDEDGDTDGIDFLSWQSGFGSFSAFVTVGDGDGDADFGVDAQDLGAWEANFGETTGESAPLAATAGDPPPASLPQTAPVSASAPVEETPLFAAAALLTEQAMTNEAPLQTSVQVSQLPTATPLTAGSNENAQQRDALLSLSQTTRNAEEFGLPRLRRHAAATRFESLSFDTMLDRSSEIANARLAVRDRALDHLFAKRQRPVDLVEELADRESDAEDAFALAFGEETNWRFG